MVFQSVVVLLTEPISESISTDTSCGPNISFAEGHTAVIPDMVDTVADKSVLLNTKSK